MKLNYSNFACLKNTKHHKYLDFVIYYFYKDSSETSAHVQTL